ncbi:hypothetical protein FD30_GL000467 [Levilactobacillus namurensis DSM 19117]|uniref:Zinc-ribbon domain-containing protein n=1 Tax=Levilactobacillus namurensis DSM 19117 TaxID=1423773 RepID=A0A0R1KBH7_9LACO|nr:DUF805 domain-containing protein [Levilactobacillus namurensis]KRK77106.1 hypothetical protein FD30_GL000467 [Levilactobacillus namurensis DSM 19117]GEO73314.1 membrane protein [Levilactobacillus namurensis]
MNVNEPKFCVSCGTALSKTSEFCSKCGTKQPQVGNQAEAVNHEKDPVEANPNMVSAFILGIKDAFVFSKTLGRASYWWLFLDFTILNLILGSFLLTKATQMFSFGMSPLKLYDVPQLAVQLLASGLIVFLGVMMMSASIRRLHDTNHSGNYLWFIMLPVVGAVILAFMQAKPTDIKGQNYDKNAHSSKWQGKWQNWLVLGTLTILGTFFLNTVAYNDTMSKYSSTATGTAHATNSESTADEHSSSTESASEDNSKSIQLSDAKIDIADQKEYATDFSDSSWTNTNFVIDKVTVYKTEGTYKDGDKSDFKGIVKVHMKIRAGRDLTTYPAQGTLSTNDGQQVDADMHDSDDFDGELNANANREGNIYFLIPKLNSVKDLSTIRLKWSAYYETDNIDDENDHKEYDTTLNLAS